MPRKTRVKAGAPTTRAPPAARRAARGSAKKGAGRANEPVAVKRGRKPGSKNKVQKFLPDRYRTYFRAQGHNGVGKTPDAGATEAPPGFVSGPSKFYSNEGFIPVVFNGIVSLKTIISFLNESLNIRTKRGRLGDFREAYRVWKFKYQVIKDQDTGNRKPDGRPIFKSTIIDRQRGSSRAGRR